jgi:hypothetical protein
MHDFNYEVDRNKKKVRATCEPCKWYGPWRNEERESGFIPFIKIDGSAKIRQDFECHAK